MKDARAIVGTRMLHRRFDAQHRAGTGGWFSDGANYLGAGPTFPSRTKAFDDFAGLRVFAVDGGGDSAADVCDWWDRWRICPKCWRCGIERVAVSGAVTGKGQAAERLSPRGNCCVCWRAGPLKRLPSDPIRSSDSLLPCFTRSSWPAAPAPDFGPPVATIRRSSCCSWSATRR